MVRLWSLFGMGWIIVSLFFGYENGWAQQKVTVKSGDTLYTIAKSAGVSVEALKKANALQNNTIKPKQVLAMPTGEGRKGGRVRGKIQPPFRKEVSAEVRNLRSSELPSYIVQKGEDLYTISKKVGCSAEEIKKVNSLSTSSLKTGQVLLLPSTASAQEGDKEELGEEDEIAETETESSVPLGKWSNSEERSVMVRVARAFLGVPYKLGGSTLKGIDCSALVKKVYEVFNIHLPRTTREQFRVGIRIGMEQLKEGDLVFFKRRGNNAHVGIYVGDNQFVHASSYGREVRVDYLNTPYYRRRFLRGVRVMELEKAI